MQAFNFPTDVSFSFGGPGSPRYLVNQIHYDNPNRVSGKSIVITLIAQYKLYITVFRNGIQAMSRAPLTRLSIHKIWKQKYLVNSSTLRYNVAYTTLMYCPAYEDKQSWTMYLLCHTP